MPISKPFSALSREDVGEAGGKGASLGEMTRAGIPVPPGLVVLSQTFDRFLEETDLFQEIDSILHTVDHKEIHTVEQASARIQALIKNANMPEDIAQDILAQFQTLGAEFVAVRSSATAEDSASAAWAGQLDSFLNTTKDTLLQNVQNCWASLFTPRAIFYRFEQGLHGQRISVAVVIQKMVASDTSGIAFSVHPVTEDYNQLIIEAGFGLGEAIVSGQVTPDSYVVEKEPRRILDVNVSHQTRALYRAADGGNEWRNLDELLGNSQVLTQEKIQELSDLILHIEAHYSFPCDIEWAIENNKIFIVQSRPITTLKPKEDARPMLECFGTRDFTVAFAQVLILSEKKPHEWMNGESPQGAYIVAEYKDNILSFYLERRSVDHIKKTVARQLKSSPTLPGTVIQNVRSSAQPILSIFKEPRALSPQEFPAFLKSLQKTWGWLAAMWWLLDNKEVEQHYPDAFKSLLALREETDFYLPAVDQIIRKSLEKQYPDQQEHVATVSINEFLQGTPVDAITLKERQRYSFIDEQGVFTGEEAREHAKQYVLKTPASPEASQKTVSGEVASPGTHRGIVRVVLKKQDLNNVKEGDVIVASTTTPDWMPALKIAGAIVADEGGVISHAAIVSRELKKPCIIGTKVATQVLKTGDEVEVDADNGTVTILKRA